MQDVVRLVSTIGAHIVRLLLGGEEVGGWVLGVGGWVGGVLGRRRRLGGTGERSGRHCGRRLTFDGGVWIQGALDVIAIVGLCFWVGHLDGR